MAIVYQHIRKDTNQIFYIGIGKKVDRAYYKLRRNKYWTNIFNKTEIEVKIVCDDVDLKTAYQIEKYLISYYGRFDLGLGSLVNMTSGGESINDLVITDSHRLKMSLAKKGKKRICNTGQNHFMYGKNHSDEYKQKMSESLKAVKNTEENKAKVSQQFKGTKQSKEHIAKRIAAMPKHHEKKTCPNCGLVGAGGNMIRYHFNNCKKLNIC